ncbi:Flightin [Armadillidium nasatum]|uniref:Flightin n=1 Tax=Armadillidium nasatum TaxID=96803 RepID=A0A5N5T6W2_9CRUS|nr:Flightin [Armadillidium nasatum]
MLVYRDKKKKVKKVKKVEKPADEAAAPAPEAEPTPDPASEPEPAAPAKGDDWLSESTAEKTEEAAPEAQAEQAPHEEGAAEGIEGDVVAEAPPAPKKKPKFFIHWNRRKPKFYDYNFDYGTNYYSSVIGYLDNKNLGASEIIPRRKAFAERGIDSSVVRKSQPDLVTQNLMHNVRSSIRGYENFARDYAFDVDRKYFE